MSEDFLTLTDAPHVALKHAPLALSICQIRFRSLFGVTEQSIVAFQQALQAKYPVADNVEAAESSVEIDNLSTGIKREQKKIYQWQFTDQDDNWRVVLSHDSLALEARTYDHFDEFLDRLQEAIGLLIEHVQPTSLTRFGLRYINEIRANTLRANTRWSSIICSQLLGPLGAPEFVEHATGIASTHQLTFYYTDNIRLNIHHGLRGKGTTLREPQKTRVITDAFYLLDFDAFREFPPAGTVQEVNSRVVLQCAKQYHEIIYRLFRWSVTQEYIAMIAEVTP